MWRTSLLSFLLLACIRESEQKACFQGCHVSPDPQSCFSSPYDCGVDEFCLMTIKHDGVHLECKHNNELSQSVDEFSANQDYCDPNLEHTADKVAPCVYPCPTKQCLHDLFTAPQTTVAPLLLPNEGCYDSPCDPRLGNCAGQWICNGFCEIHTYHSTGESNMTCSENRWINFETCRQDMINNYCDVQGGHLEHDCHFCCDDRHCVDLLYAILHAPAAPTCADTTTAPTTATTVTTTATTAAPYQNCVDQYAGDCTAHFSIPEDCANPAVQIVCPRSCDACPVPTTTTPTTTAHTTSVTRKCAECYGLACLMSDPSKVCESSKAYCMTRVSDTGRGREIKRMCASQDDCAKIQRMSTCLEVENMVLGTGGTTCEYCCNVDNCNEPPQLIPKTGLITNHNAP